MKQELLRIRRRYKTGLRTWLRSNALMSAVKGESLGRSAVSQGLETLDLAKIHGDTLLELIPNDCAPAARSRAVEQAGAFFLDVIGPVERTHRGMVESLLELRRSNESLRDSTLRLLAANRDLKAQAAQRKSAETALQLSEKKHRRLLGEARQMQLRLRHLSHQVLSAQEEERKEISRELHDEIVQTLTGINVQLASLKIEAGASKQSFSRHIAYTQRLVEKSVDIVHQFARDLRPTLLDDLGLNPALHAYMKTFTGRTGLQIDFSTFADIEKLRNDKRTVLYRVAQAALINIAQHAKATTVSVQIKDLPQFVIMEIKDDGISFDVHHVLDSRRNKRLGLIGMRERVEMVGGTFSVASAPGCGTKISAMIPFKRKSNTP